MRHPIASLYTTSAGILKSNEYACLEKSENYSALVGEVKSFEESGELTKPIELLQKKLSDFEGTSYYYNLEFTLADLYSKSGFAGKSDSLYRLIAEQKPNRSLEYLANVNHFLLAC